MIIEIIMYPEFQTLLILLIPRDTDTKWLVYLNLKKKKVFKKNNVCLYI